MVVAPLTEFGIYVKLHPLFEKVEQALITLDFGKPGEKIYVDGESVFAIPSFNRAKAREEALLEAHDKYIDIQVCLQGTETIGWRNRSSCHSPRAPFDREKDIIFFADSPENYIKVPELHFAIFFPNDSHAPLIGDGFIRKVVFKVLAGVACNFLHY